MKNIFTFFLLGMLLSGCAFIRKSNDSNDISFVYCPPDNRPLAIIKNVDKIFPLYAINYTSKASAAFAGLVTIKGEESKEVVRLQEFLDQDNVALQSKLKGAYLAYQLNPCDTTNAKNFWATLAAINIRGDMFDDILYLLSTYSINTQSKDSTFKAEIDKKVDSLLYVLYQKESIAWLRDEMLKGVSSEVGRVRNDLVAHFLRSSVGLTRYVLGEMYFKSGKNDLTEDGKRYLRNIGAIFKPQLQRGKEILIFGHADSIPIHQNYTDTYKNNFDLSIARANAVAQFLIEELDFDPLQVNITGFAEDHPIVPNDSEENRQRNRRAEVLLVTEDDLLLIPHQGVEYKKLKLQLPKRQ